jgi:hypothetical protein
MLELGPLAHIDGEPEPDELPMRPPAPEMFANSVPPAPVSGIGRLVSAALVGVVLGIFVGYAIWGRATSVDIASTGRGRSADRIAGHHAAIGVTPTGARASRRAAPPDVIAPVS